MSDSGLWLLSKQLSKSMIFICKRRLYKDKTVMHVVMDGTNGLGTKIHKLWIGNRCFGIKFDFKNS